MDLNQLLLLIMNLSTLVFVVYTIPLLRLLRAFLRAYMETGRYCESFGSGVCRPGLGECQQRGNWVMPPSTKKEKVGS